MPRGRLVLGVAVVTVLAGLAAWAVAQFRGAADPGSLVYLAAEGEVVVRDLSSGEERAAGDLPDGASDLALGPDGRLAYAHEGAAWVLDLDGGEPQRLGEGEPAAWSADGRLAVVRQTPRGRRTLAFVDGGEIVPAGLGGPDGDPVWIAQDLFAVRLLDREGEGAALHVVRLQDGNPSDAHVIPGGRSLAASPDGAELLYVGADDRLHILSVEGFSSRPADLAGSFIDAAASPEGLVAVTGRDAGGEPGLWVLTATDVPEKLADVAAEDIAWTRDGSHVLYAAGEAVFSVTVPDGAPERLDVRPAPDAFIAVIP